MPEKCTRPICRTVRGGRSPYSAPRLREYGHVGALTQSGTGTMVEGGMGMGGMSMNPNARP